MGQLNFGFTRNSRVHLKINTFMENLILKLLIRANILKFVWKRENIQLIWAGVEPKLVFGPQLENFGKNIGFLGRMTIKTWRNTPKMSKNRWFSILVWAAENYFWAAGWPPLNLRLRNLNKKKQLNWSLWFNLILKSVFTSFISNFLIFFGTSDLRRTF